MALFLLISEDGYTEQTDLEPKIDSTSWPKVIRIRNEDGVCTFEVHTPSEGGWCELPEA